MKSTIEDYAEKHKKKIKEKSDHTKKLTQKLDASSKGTISANKKDVDLDSNDSLEDLSHCAMFICDLDTWPVL